MSKGVFVYRNLNRKGVVWSVKSKRTGLVVSRSSYVVIKDAVFKVSQKGRERVLREGRKNVHAGVVGTWVRSDKAQMCVDTRSWISGPQKGWVRVRYNPRKLTTFVRDDSELPVSKAAFVILDEQGAWAYMPR